VGCWTLARRVVIVRNRQSASIGLYLTKKTKVKKKGCKVQRSEDSISSGLSENR
jgi:hypothetical protein